MADFMSSGDQAVVVISTTKEPAAAVFDYAAARANLARRARRDTAANRRLWRQAERDAKAIVALIAERYRPTAIFQWGSVLHPERFREYSDVDVAVAGIPDAESYFRMLGDAMVLTKFPLDLVDLDKIAPEHADTIRRHGRQVYP